MSETAQSALIKATKALDSVGIERAHRDARRLMSHTLEISLDRLNLMVRDEITAEQSARFQSYVNARSNHQPVAQIIGKRSFWGRDFLVTQDVLDPRPETETIIAAVLDTPAPKTMLDLGTGSGCIALTLLAEIADLSAVASDISNAALAVAGKNAGNLGLLPRVQFVKSNWFENLSGTYDLIVANPPYISGDEMTGLSNDVKNWEPRIALTPGGDGLDSYRAISRGLSGYLNPGGQAFFEIGHAQSEAVLRIFSAQAWQNVKVLPDMNGHARVVVVRNG